jgi:hypothetical protein
MARLTTAAWIAHNIGLAASFGGQLFGKLALNPKLAVLSARDERGKMLNAAWNRYNVVNAVSFGVAALTWFLGRAGVSGRSIDEEARNLVLAKDALFVAGALTGLASIFSGLRLTRQAPDGATPIQTGTEPAPDTPEEAAGLLRTVNVLGNLSLGIIASIIAVTTILSQKAGQSTRWSAVSRFLP